MGDTMFMPETWEEFLKDYEFKDHKELYTNGSMMIQSFRVKQMMEHYARPKHGRWENLGEYYERGRTSTQYRCSECGRRAGYKQVKLYHYCPNCGCKMDKGE